LCSAPRLPPPALSKTFRIHWFVHSARAQLAGITAPPPTRCLHAYRSDISWCFQTPLVVVVVGRGSAPVCIHREGGVAPAPIRSGRKSSACCSSRQKGTQVSKCRRMAACRRQTRSAVRSRAIGHFVAGSRPGLPWRTRSDPPPTMPASRLAPHQGHPEQWSSGCKGQVAVRVIRAHHSQAGQVSGCRSELLGGGGISALQAEAGCPTTARRMRLMRLFRERQQLQIW
jgi:hypothetical protein